MLRDLLLVHALTLTYFDEPRPTPDAPPRSEGYVRAPWFMVMEWAKPEAKFLLRSTRLEICTLKPQQNAQI